MTCRWYISPADTPDISGIVALYREAQGWLRSQGFDQWQDHPRVADRIRDDVTGATGVWVVKDCAGQLVGTLKLDEHADPEFWRLEDEPTTAFYAHRMIVARSHAGLHLGSAMLDWASLRAFEAGKRWLRFDAWATNTRLHDHYVNEGFTLVRLLHLEHRGSGALFQRAAGVTSVTGPHLHLDLPLHLRPHS